jgi:hypothetical protein
VAGVPNESTTRGTPSRRGGKVSPCKHRRRQLLGEDAEIAVPKPRSAGTLPVSFPHCLCHTTNATMRLRSLCDGWVHRNARRVRAERSYADIIKEQGIGKIQHVRSIGWLACLNIKVRNF